MVRLDYGELRTHAVLKRASYRRSLRPHWPPSGALDWNLRTGRHDVRAGIHRLPVAYSCVTARGRHHEFQYCRRSSLHCRRHRGIQARRCFWAHRCNIRYRFYSWPSTGWHARRSRSPHSVSLCWRDLHHQFFLRALRITGKSKRAV